MCKLFELPDYDQAAVLQFHNVINEPDFLPLHVVRNLRRRAEFQCAIDIALSLQPPDPPEFRRADLGQIVADHSSYHTAPRSPCRCDCKGASECTMPPETHVAMPEGGACCPKMRWRCGQ
jgi:hypothetical protein